VRPPQEALRYGLILRLGALPGRYIEPVSKGKQKIVGSGGVGKTRLAIQVGAELLDQYRDGVWFVDSVADRIGQDRPTKFESHSRATKTSLSSFPWSAAFSTVYTRSSGLFRRGSAACSVPHCPCEDSAEFIGKETRYVDVDVDFAK
jgi:hypothetical protein